MKNLEKKKKPLQEEAQKWKFYSNHWYTHSNQILCPIFDGLAKICD
jgi:hypothetical protein